MGLSLVELIHDEVASAARRLSVGTMVAARIAQSVEERLRREFGGSRVYVPTPDVAARNREILDEYRRGADKEDLCHRFGISRRMLNYVLAENSGP